MECQSIYGRKGMTKMVEARWRKGVGFFSKADPNKVAKEVSDIGDEATAQQIVDKARSEETELHKCFTWDDTAAAEKYRLYEARCMLSALVIVRDDAPKTETDVPLPEIRVFHKIDRNPNTGYKPLEVIVKHEDEYKALLAQAMREMTSFVQKYKSLSELDDLIDMMEELLMVS